MDRKALIERLLQDNPTLHYINENEVEDFAKSGINYQFEAGQVSWAVAPEVIHYLSDVVKPSDRTIETGGGHTTIAFAALGHHHTCVTLDERNVELTKKYLEKSGIGADKVTFIVESSDTALPKLKGEFDFAFIDGNHAYPFPALDWHYLDQRLKIGGIVGLDNTEMRAVHDHCLFLDENGTYKLRGKVADTIYGKNYGVSFYSKLDDDGRDALRQAYSRKRARKRTLSERIKQVLRPEPKIWPWD